MTKANAELYEIGYGWAKMLRPLCECAQEHAAVNRLEDFRGDAADVRTCAAMFSRVGEDENAAELLRMLR